MSASSPPTAMGAHCEIFISYASKDAARAVAIALLLEKAGVSVWRDGDRILGGQYYGEQIAHALAHSRVVLLICSPESLASDNVHREVILTWEWYHRRYVPVWVAPPAAIPERFRYCLVGCQWIDAHFQPPDCWLPQLLSALKAQGLEPSAPTGKSDTGSRSPSMGRGPKKRFTASAIGVAVVLLAFAMGLWASGIFRPAETHPSPQPGASHDGPLGMKFVHMPKGTFNMGGGSGNAKQKTEIKDDFEIAVCTVTQGQWEALMDGDNPSMFRLRGENAMDVQDISDEALKHFPWKMRRGTWFRSSSKR